MNESTDGKLSVRLNKYIAECGICSRREADKLIEAGLITVNGTTAVAGLKVAPNDVVSYKGSVISPVKNKTVLAYYKPVGVTCTKRDEHAEVTLPDVIDYPVRLTYAGRLDKDSEGLLLLTNDGDLIEALMRGANGHEKEYEVTVDKPLDKSLIAKMERGLYLEELDVTTRPCRIVITGDKSFNIILTQGLNRQIRRMCETCGYNVVRLKRVRVANIVLGDLISGQYREITGAELKELYAELI